MRQRHRRRENPMGIDYWNHSRFLHHKVRNMLRRGWLIKTYYDKKILQVRFKTGEKIENDRIDMVHPVGFLGRNKPGDKVEVLSMDIDGDTSRRICFMTIGDREHHPKIDEGESILYSPGDKKKFVRVRKGDQNSSPNNEYGKNRSGAIETDADDLPVMSTTKDAYSNKADKGIGNETGANFTVKAGSNTQMSAAKHIRQGEHHISANAFVNGKHHAADHLAGGGTNIGVTSLRAGETGREDGSKNWSATGKPGTVSLLATAQALTETTQALDAFKQEQQQKNSQQDARMNGIDATIVALTARVAALEEAMLGGSGAISALQSHVAFHDFQIDSLDDRVTVLETS
jgi:hypothetical protein